jgi:catechol 2,3-dioxygenase-like lactoylglutathione lyase family enzyme
LVNPQISVITLGVRDLDRARRFYREGLGWPIGQEDDNWVCFTLAGGNLALAIYPVDDLAEDARVAPEGSGFRGFTLSYIVRSDQRVDEILAEAKDAGATITKTPERTSWGGYSGYFADPDGHLWEVAAGATQLPFAE